MHLFKQRVLVDILTKTTAASTSKKVNNNSPKSFDTQCISHFAWTLTSCLKMVTPTDHFFSPGHFDNDTHTPVRGKKEKPYRQVEIGVQPKSQDGDPLLCHQHFFLTRNFQKVPKLENSMSNAHIPITVSTVFNFLPSFITPLPAQSLNHYINKRVGLRFSRPIHADINNNDYSLIYCPSM